MFKKILTFGFAVVLCVMALGTAVSAIPRAIRENTSNQGFGYKAYTTNMKYEMITNGQDGEIWVSFNSSTENTLYRFEGSVDDLVTVENNLSNAGMPYSKVYSVVEFILNGDIETAANVLDEFFDFGPEGKKTVNELTAIVDDLVYYYEKLLGYETPESKNECYWSGSSWICKYNLGENHGK